VFEYLLKYLATIELLKSICTCFNSAY